MPEEDQGEHSEVLRDGPVPLLVQAAQRHYEQSVIFQYIKSPMFRTNHVDGAIGGVTPRKYIHCAVYSERAAVPRAMEHEVKDGKTTGEASIVQTRVGYVRELEADLMLDLDSAKALSKWLDQRVAELEKAGEDAG